MIGIPQWSVHFAHFFWQNIDGMDRKSLLLFAFRELWCCNCTCVQINSVNRQKKPVSSLSSGPRAREAARGCVDSGDGRERTPPAAKACRMSCEYKLSPACDVQHVCDWNSISLVKYEARCQRFLLLHCVQKTRFSSIWRGKRYIKHLFWAALKKNTHKLIKKNCFIFNRNSAGARGHALQCFLHLLLEKKKTL